MQPIDADAMYETTVKAGEPSRGVVGGKSTWVRVPVGLAGATFPVRSSLRS